MYIFSARALASCRRCPLSLHVGPRMPTLTGTSTSFEIQGRAPRGASAFTTFRKQFRQLLGGQNSSLTLWRATLATLFLLGIPCRRCETVPCNASSPVASTQCGFRVLQLGASSGLPALHGARPNPSLKRSANGSPPGPVNGAGAFSTARAWRATVVSRLAHTLGLTKTKVCVKSIKAAPATQAAESTEIGRAHV